MITKFKTTFQPFIAIIAKPFLFIHPNLITILGLFFPVLFFYFLMKGSYFFCIITSIGFIFDAIDGYVARSTGKISPFGAILDATSDRLSDAIIISSFGFARLVPWSLVLGVLVSTYLISFIKARGEATTGKAMSEGLMQRTERIIVIFLSVILVIVFGSASSSHIFFATFGILFVLNMVTIGQRLWYFFQLTS